MCTYTTRTFKNSKRCCGDKRLVYISTKKSWLESSQTLDITRDFVPMNDIHKCF